MTRQQAMKIGEATRNAFGVTSRCLVNRSFRIARYASLAVAVLSVPILVRGQAPAKAAERNRYEIKLKLNFDERSFTGTERVRWVNRGDRTTSNLYFHLYSNVRVEGQSNSSVTRSTNPESDEPRLDLLSVRLATTDAPLGVNFEDQGATLRINLSESVPPGGMVEVVVDFKGSVPEIDPEESGITTHVIKQVSAALRDERETRRARDVNFRCRGVMFLGTAYPVLAVHDGDEWRRRLEPSIGDMIFNETSDYEVSISTAPGVAVFSSGVEQEVKEPSDKGRMFVGAALGDLGIVAGRGLRAEETTVGYYGKVTQC